MSNLQKAFQKLSSNKPPLSLKTAILSRIEIEKNRKVKQRLIFSYAGLISSVILGIYTTFAFGNSFLKSDFWSVISLAFSDGGTIARFWNDFLYSLMETFPAFALAAILTPLFIFMLSISSYLNINERKNHKFI